MKFQIHVSSKNKNIENVSSVLNSALLSFLIAIFLISYQFLLSFEINFWINYVTYKIARNNYYQGYWGNRKHNILWVKRREMYVSSIRWVVLIYFISKTSTQKIIRPLHPTQHYNPNWITNLHSDSTVKTILPPWFMGMLFYQHHWALIVGR